MSKSQYRLIAIAIVFVLGTFILRSQTPPQAQEKPAGIITRTFDVKYTDPNQIYYTLQAIAKANGVVITVDARNRLLLLTGSPDRIDNMEDLIRRLDTVSTPEKNMEITVYLLTAGDAAGASQEIPPQLDPVLKQLRAIFTYKSYKVLDTIFMRNRVGAEGRTNGFLPLSDEKQRSYSLMYDRSYLTRDDKVDVIHLSGMKLAVDSGGSIATDVDLRNGQMVVVGKTSFQNSALIAVITARVLD